MSAESGSQPWIVQDTDPGVHVVPASDHIEHSLDEDCSCGVTPLPETRADGSVGWVLVHHSLDGREQDERARAAGDDGGDT